MNDSADIKTATNRLQEALRSLEASLTPAISKISTLQTQALDAQSYQREAESFKLDRANLAAQLDEAQSKEAEATARSEQFAAREAEFNTLANDTTRELDAVISQVERALRDAKGTQS